MKVLVQKNFLSCLVLSKSQTFPSFSIKSFDMIISKSTKSFLQNGGIPVDTTPIKLLNKRFLPVL